MKSANAETIAAKSRHQVREPTMTQWKSDELLKKYI
jgi:hypothetical protein